MTRWIATEDRTTQALRDRRIDAELSSADSMEAALSSAPSVLVLPGSGTDAIVAMVRRGAQRAEFSVHRWADANAVGYQAGGMLGLLDEPVFEGEPAAPKKKWWQRKGE